MSPEGASVPQPKAAIQSRSGKTSHTRKSLCRQSILRDAGENRPIQRTSINSDRTRLLTRRWMHKAMAWGRGIALCVLVLLLAACDGHTHLTFLNPQGPVADAQRWHFYEVLGIMAVLVAGPISLLLPFFAWRYRYGNAERTSELLTQVTSPGVWEITAWGGAAIVMRVAVLAFFVWRDSHRLDPYRPAGLG